MTRYMRKASEEDVVRAYRYLGRGAARSKMNGQN